MWIGDGISISTDYLFLDKSITLDYIIVNSFYYIILREWLTHSDSPWQKPN